MNYLYKPYNCVCTCTHVITVIMGKHSGYRYMCICYGKDQFMLEPQLHFSQLHHAICMFTAFI